MGRQRNNDPVVFQSSIALLQERFKELQRVKEMREEKELHRMVAEEPKLLFNPTTMHYYYEPSKLFFHFLPPKSSPTPSSLSSPSSSTTTTSQVSSLSLWSDSVQSSKLDDDHFQYQCMGIDHAAPLPMSYFQPAETSSVHGSALCKLADSIYDVDDVDTSLHL
ncbi:hypothetical protein ACOSP7_015865 [Xanthoceras sorbifolium]|uniref:Uncharacterized protein n=1 Tax=Xanthoceras sorbifolium TaxID=99658 RepID=A0ABQ8I7Q7_9ROSI|nr:hypothetical protein JRO89_XS04G0287000 [Xanthoceras sorbifolium]